MSDERPVLGLDSRDLLEIALQATYGAQKRPEKDFIFQAISRTGPFDGKRLFRTLPAPTCPSISVAKLCFLRFRHSKTAALDLLSATIPMSDSADGRAPRSGQGGRRFKSCHSDQHLDDFLRRLPTNILTET
jgi:hypothetical protein